jgi:ferredoxin-NADP reductase
VISTVDVGRASKLLFDAEPGFEATVTGPFGRLVLPEKLPKRLFLVATSVGIAPYMPMLDTLRDSLQQGDVDVYFLYGTRDAGEFIYGKVLSEFARQYENFHLTVCYSRIEYGDASIHPHPNVTVAFGYVQNNIAELAMNPETDHVLLCGNPMMIDDLYPQLKQQGFGVRQVVREKYVFAKRPGVKKPAVEMTAEQKRLLAEKMKKYS